MMMVIMSSHVFMSFLFDSDGDDGGYGNESDPVPEPSAV